MVPIFEKHGLELLGPPLISRPPTTASDQRGRESCYPKAITELKRTGELSRRCRCRPVRHLNNVLEQDHRSIKRRFRTYRRQLEKRLGQSDAAPGEDGVSSTRA
jgi:DDE superfamily endonuclease